MYNSLFLLILYSIVYQWLHTLDTSIKGSKTSLRVENNETVKNELNLTNAFLTQSQKGKTFGMYFVEWFIKTIEDFEQSKSSIYLPPSEYKLFEHRHTYLLDEQRAKLFSFDVSKEEITVDLSTIPILDMQGEEEKVDDQVQMEMMLEERVNYIEEKAKEYYQEKYGRNPDGNELEQFKEMFMKQLQMEKEEVDDYLEEKDMLEDENEDILEEGDDYGEMPQGTDNE
jgi:hypothetical protein